MDRKAMAKETLRIIDQGYYEADGTHVDIQSMQKASVKGSFLLTPEQGEELFFVMNATEGNKLLVLKFQAENLSDGENSLDIAQSGTRFKIVVNGTEKNALTTMLLNDLAYYQKTLNAGESQEVVLICEIPESEEVSSLGLVMKNEETSTEISLE